MKTEDDGKGKVKKTRGCFLVFGALFVSFLLVSIYLPSYISYREMTFCTKAESDANAVAAAIADYFSDPNHTATPTLDQLKNWTSVTLSGKNTATVTGSDPNVHITITVTDASGKCPADYQAASDDWDGNNVYILTLTQ